jgi:hypothetical protein
VSRKEREANSSAEPSFLSTYLEYTSQTECPTFFHRWCALTSLAAWIGRDIYFPFGGERIHANMYVMLIGLAGTKKSTAIKKAAKVIKQAGYKKFAAKKTRQEKFLIDLAEDADSISDSDNILDENLFGSVDAESAPPAEVFVAADEINNFIGTGNLDFMSILGELWDIDEVFDYKLKNSKSVYIPYPTITILGGNTFVGFNKLFPPEATEQGFFSRMLFIYAEPKGRLFTIPPEPDPELLELMKLQLKKIKGKVRGKILITDDAYILLDKIYMSWGGMNDSRFDSYENRRSVHLLKLAMLLMADRVDTTVSKADILKANTILTYTEHLMPKALGEFGRARISSITHKVMEIIDNTELPVSFQAIWKATYQDLDSRDQLIALLGNLQVAEKIQAVSSNGYLPIKKVRKAGIEGAIDWSLLTPEERDLI